MNTWSCARCGTAAFADQNFCRACGMPREGRRQVPITSQVPIIRTAIEPDPLAPEDRRAIDDPRTSANQSDEVTRTGGAGRRPRKRPISLLLLVVIAVAFLVLGGVAAVVFGNIRDDTNDEPSPTTAVPTVTTAPSTTRAPTTTAEPTSTSRPAATTTTERSATTEPSATTAEPSTPTATSLPPISSPPTTPGS